MPCMSKKKGHVENSFGMVFTNLFKMFSNLKEALDVIRPVEVLLQNNIEIQMS